MESEENISVKNKEIIEPELLEEIEQALKVPVEAIKNFDKKKVSFNISCNF